jgi:hypothetical protein
MASLSSRSQLWYQRLPDIRDIFGNPFPKLFIRAVVDLSQIFAFVVFEQTSIEKIAYFAGLASLSWPWCGIATVSRRLFELPKRKAGSSSSTKGRFSARRGNGRRKAGRRTVSLSATRLSPCSAGAQESRPPAPGSQRGGESCADRPEKSGDRRQAGRGVGR